MCYIRIFELCDRLLNNKIEKDASDVLHLLQKYVCQGNMFDIFLIYIGNYDNMLP